MLEKIKEILLSFKGKSVCVTNYGFSGTLKSYDELSVDETDLYLVVGDLLDSDYFWIHKMDIVNYKEENNALRIYGNIGHEILIEIM